MSRRGSILLLVAAAALMLVYSLPASAQLYNDVVTNSRGQPIAGSSYTVCNTSTAGGSCSSLATLYTDQTLTTPCNGTNGCVNPVISDPLGRVVFYATSGIYYTIVASYESIPYNGIIEVPGTGGGGGGGVTPCGLLNDVQLYGTALALGCDTGVFTEDPSTHTVVDTIVQATQEVDVLNVTQAGELDLSAGTLGTAVPAGTVGFTAPATATGVRYIFPGAPGSDGAPFKQVSHSGTDVTLGYGTNGICDGLGTNPGDICYFNGTHWVIFPGNSSGTKWLQESAIGVPSWTVPSATGLVNYENLIPLWTSNCPLPGAPCNDLISTQIPWFQSTFYRGPVAPTQPNSAWVQDKICNLEPINDVVCTFDNPIIPGDSIYAIGFVSCGLGCSGQDFTITDSIAAPIGGSNTYTDISHSDGGGNAKPMLASYSSAVKGGITTVTFHPVSTGSYEAIFHIFELRGAITPNVFSYSSPTATPPIVFDALTTTVAPTAIIATFASATAVADSYTAGTGYKMLSQSFGSVLSLGSEITNESTTGTYTPTMTNTASTSFSGAFDVAFHITLPTSSADPVPGFIYYNDLVQGGDFPSQTGKSGLSLGTDGSIITWDHGVYLHGTGLLAAPHTVIGMCVIGSTCTSLTLTGAEVFTSSTSYVCTGVDQTGIYAISISQASGSAFTITGNGTDTVDFSCTGN